MKKSILSILLTVAMLAAMIPAFGVVAFADEAPAATVTDWTASTVELKNITDVYNFFNTQLKERNFEGQTVKLACSPDFAEYTFTGRTNDYKAFAGTFDGQGNVIYNLKFEVNAGNGGLFGNSSPAVSPTIKNVAFVDCNMNGNWQPGLLYGGEANNTTTIYIQNVYVKNLTHGTKAASYGGGLVGFGRVDADNVVVTSTKQTAPSTGNNRFGGLIANSYGASSFTNCAFYGKVTLSNAGGFVAENGGNVTLNDCISILDSASSSMRTYAYGGTPVAEEGSIALTMTGYGGGRQTDMVNAGDLKAYAEAAYIGVGAQSILTENSMDGWTATTTGYPMPISLVKTFPSLFENEVEGTPMTLHGYQTTTATENKFAMRLVATIATEDLSQYKNIGFKVVANFGTSTKATAISSTVVYNSVSANGEDGAKGYTVAQLLNDESAKGYIFALAITGVPANQGDITFEVTTFYTDANDNVVNGSTEVFTVDVDSIPATELPNV